jgi:hypothetical protein
VTVTGEGEYEYYIAGVAAGNWTVSVDGKTLESVAVADGENILSFTASAGNITLKLK